MSYHPIVYSVVPLSSYEGWAVIELIGDHEPDQLTGYPKREDAERRARDEAKWSTRQGIPAVYREPGEEASDAR